jgi:hypothetical protein
MGSWLGIGGKLVALIRKASSTWNFTLNLVVHPTIYSAKPGRGGIQLTKILQALRRRRHGLAVAADSNSKK